MPRRRSGTTHPAIQVATTEGTATLVLNKPCAARHFKDKAERLGYEVTADAIINQVYWNDADAVEDLRAFGAAAQR